MWSGQPPEDERNLHSEDPYQRPPWPQPPGGGNRAKVVAVAAATTVVAAVGLSGFLLLGGAKDDHAGGGGNSKAPTAASKSVTTSAPASPKPHSTETERPTVPGWKVVVNPKWGTAFDVPPGWDVRPPDMLIGFDDSTVDYSNPANWGKTVIVMSAPAILRENWCLSDDDKDGRMDSTGLAMAGTKGSKGSRSTAEVALSLADLWVYGGYTQPDRKSIVRDRTAQPYTTRSGVKGSIAWARSRNTPQKGRCAGDGKAVTFGFRNSAGGFVAWSLVGATGVKDELPDSTIMKILSTVRLHGKPTESS
ncbi:hypothetical protein [Streptomyces sp. NPDC050121]|uniref:hypothetical protein n=1 Tax=Streptomyces sp. NPDC050121 TaxID=3365601 RepID=UPI0037B38DE4